MNWMRLKLPPRTCGERLDRQRLGQAGHALEQHVAAGEQRDEQPLEHRVLADDDALDLVERLLERAARASLAAAAVRSLVGTGSSGSPFRRQMRRPNQAQGHARRPASSSTSAPPANADGDLALLLLVAELGAELLVDRAQALGVGAVKDWPPDAAAICASACGSGGTGAVLGACRRGA